MNWYYVNQGQRVGPIDDEAVQRLAGAGAIKADTLVWNETMTDWQPYSAVSAGAVAGQSPPVVGNICSECGRQFSADEMIQVGDAWVCANCKPILVQKLKGGVGTGGGAPGAVSIEDVLARDYALSLGDAVSGAWATYKENFGGILGATLVIFGLIVVCGVIPFGVGALAQLILQGPLMGGLYIYCLNKIRGQDGSINEVFSGFGPRFVNLMLAHIVSGILAGLCFVPAGVLVVMGIVTSMRSHSARPDFGMMGALLVPAIVLGVLGLCAAAYLTVSWIYSLALVADKGMRFWPAMRLSRQVAGKHWWTTFGILFVGGLIAMLGVLACFIGVLFTLPFPILITLHLYEQVLGDLNPAEG